MKESPVDSLFDLKGKIALVTGGSGHLGSAMSEALSEAGAQVIIASRDEKKCLEMAKKLSNSGIGMKLDITDDKSVADCFSNIKSKFGKLDILVNNAVEFVSGKLLEMNPRDFNRSLDVAVTGVFRMIQAAIPIMQDEDKGGASIINIASMYGIVSPDFRNYANQPEAENPPSYGAAKAGVIQLTKYAACKLAPLNIRINSVSPGAFPDEKKNSPDFIRQLASRTPMNRIGKPWELKGVVVFLAGKASTYITGQNIVIDGGWTVW